ncbi:MAG: NYN domain-containing protein [Ruminococcaceae bacterium]|nr:NYN domain-containing protein [Oscillospiraceae bacterium]
MGKGLFGLLKRGEFRSTNGLPKAIAFVDYEHWFISMEKLHHAKPNIQAWFNDLKKKCNIVEVVFFADFSKFREKEIETKRIRTFTNKIIDTYNPDAYHKKDYTDFIILDNIYQKAVTNRDIEMFIIFSGDGHFSSAAAFIRNFCNKQVGVYGVKNCISKNLSNSADWTVEVPLESEENENIYNLIFSSLKITMNKGNKQPTFMKTVESISAKYYVPAAKVKKCVIELIDKGYIIQTTETTKQHDSIRVIRPDWKKIKKDGVWMDS